MKCHKLGKKSIRGGGVKSKIKIVYISNVDYFDWRGGSEFFTFFPNSNNRNMTLTFMIYGTDIGEIYGKLPSSVPVPAKLD